MVCCVGMYVHMQMYHGCPPWRQHRVARHRASPFLGPAAAANQAAAAQAATTSTLFTGQALVWDERCPEAYKDLSCACLAPDPNVGIIMPSDTDTCLYMLLSCICMFVEFIYLYFYQPAG